MTNSYQSKLMEYLKASPLTPGEYKPTDNIKSLKLAGVYVGLSPLILTGPAEDPKSVEQAKAFIESPMLAAAVKTLGLLDELTFQFVDGQSINWPEVCEAIVSSVPGEAEGGGDTGDLMMISLYPDRGFTALLCVNTELARIIDPAAPELDDGKTLSVLAGQDTQVLKFQ